MLDQTRSLDKGSAKYLSPYSAFYITILQNINKHMIHESSSSFAMSAFVVKLHIRVAASFDAIFLSCLESESATLSTKIGLSTADIDD